MVAVVRQMGTGYVPRRVIAGELDMAHLRSANDTDLLSELIVAGKPV